MTRRALSATTLVIVLVVAVISVGGGYLLRTFSEPGATTTTSTVTYLATFVSTTTQYPAAELQVQVFSSSFPPYACISTNPCNVNGTVSILNSGPNNATIEQPAEIVFDSYSSAMTLGPTMAKPSASLTTITVSFIVLPGTSTTPGEWYSGTLYVNGTGNIFFQGQFR